MEWKTLGTSSMFCQMSELSVRRGCRGEERPWRGYLHSCYGIDGQQCEVVTLFGPPLGSVPATLVFLSVFSWQGRNSRWWIWLRLRHEHCGPRSMILASIWLLQLYSFLITSCVRFQDSHHTSVVNQPQRCAVGSWVRDQDQGSQTCDPVSHTGSLFCPLSRLYRSPAGRQRQRYLIRIGTGIWTHYRVSPLHRRLCVVQFVVPQPCSLWPRGLLGVPWSPTSAG